MGVFRPFSVAAVVIASVFAAPAAQIAVAAPAAAIAPAKLSMVRGALLDEVKVTPRVSLARRALPAAVDLSRWTVPIGNQGSAGSCVTWAINYAMMGWYSRFQGQSATGTLFAPMYAYSQIHYNDSSDGGGTYPSSAYEIASSQGVDTQADYFQGNYDWIDLPTAAETLNAANYKTGPFSYLWSGGPPGSGAVSAIESAVANHQPVAITIPVYSAFDDLNATSFHLDASQIDPNSYRGDHEVLVIGYDSSGVRIQNQWGTGWGDSGFANLDWNFLEQYSQEATVMTGFQQPKPAVPSVPTAVSGTQTAAASATITWSPPESNGASAISGYRVSRDGVNQAGFGAYTTVLPASARSFTMPDLVSGSTYNLSVQAINSAGEGPAARVAVGIAVSPLPAAPTSFVLSQTTATSATMTWAPPAVSGGQPITEYRVSRDGFDSSGYGAFTTVVPPAKRSFTMNGLVTGDTYKLSVEAVNASGTGPAVSGSVLIKAYPSVPTSFTAKQSRANSATVTWAPPTSSGGQPITGYLVARDKVDNTGNGPYSTTLAATARTITLNGLVTDKTYTLSVSAMTANGTGPAASEKVTIKAYPTAPTSVKVTQAGIGGATIVWSVPAFTGGIPITGYRVSRSGTDSGGLGYSTMVDSTVRSFTMAGLVSGGTYTLCVAAITANGTGPTAGGSIVIQ